MSKEKGIYCYAGPKGYGKTYYELKNLTKENHQLQEQLDKATKQSVIDHKYASECEDKVITYKSVLDKIREYVKEQIDYLTKIDGQNIPLNDKFQFCSMNELYQTGKYSGFREVQEKIEEILDKVEYL